MVQNLVVPTIKEWENNSQYFFIGKTKMKRENIL